MSLIHTSIRKIKRRQNDRTDFIQNLCSAKRKQNEIKVIKKKNEEEKIYSYLDNQFDFGHITIGSPIRLIIILRHFV